MRIVRSVLCVIAVMALSGCVLGYGPCLFLQPVKHGFTGLVHFRDYPASDGIDNVAILALDTTAYVYAPAQSNHCVAANDVQMVGLAEFPKDIGENSHVAVDGALFPATTARQHTTFLLSVSSILPVNARERVAAP
jgi:hypothetical protein